MLSRNTIGSLDRYIFDQLVQLLGHVGGGAVPVIVVAAEADAHFGTPGSFRVNDDGDWLRILALISPLIVAGIPAVGPEHATDKISAAICVEPEFDGGAQIGESRSSGIGRLLGRIGIGGIRDIGQLIVRFGHWARAVVGFIAYPPVDVRKKTVQQLAKRIAKCEEPNFNFGGPLLFLAIAERGVKPRRVLLLRNAAGQPRSAHRGCGRRSRPNRNRALLASFFARRCSGVERR